MGHNECGCLYDNKVCSYVYPATESNAITYAYFCLLGGLTNDKLCKVRHNNGAHIYYTYHKIDVR